jgi:8-amino-7-oxononanoate synthase
MNSFNRDLTQRLEELHHQGLYRELRRIDSPQAPRIQLDGKPLLNFSSNDYLGLANEPALKNAAAEAIQRYGAGAGASRLICGSLACHHELDETLAAFKGTEAALSFSSGYAAAHGAIGALLGKDDVIVLDKLVHACIVDAARLSGAKMRVFAHNDLNDLEDILRWADARRSSSAHEHPVRILIVTESVFSMDGDLAPLKPIVELKENYGAWLMVDEAHGTGLYGPNRRGLAEALGVSDRIEVQMGTLGKALGSAGGFLSGSRPLIDYLVNRARSFIFSTAPVPAAAAAATAGARFTQSAEGERRCATLWRRVAQFCARTPQPPSSQPSAIIPLMVGDETRAMEIATALRQQEILIPAIRYPTVARGQARLRLTVTAAHTEEDVAKLQTVLKSTWTP